MELRAYARIVWRYIWLIALIVGVVVLYSGYQYYKLRKTPGALTGYSSAVTLQIGLLATNTGDANPADNLTASETFADTLVTGPILSSKEFSGDVSAQIGLDTNEIEQQYGPNALATLGNWTDTAAIAGALSATRVDSLVTISVNWPTLVGSWAIANAVGEVSVARIANYLDYVITANTVHASASQPGVSARVISAASQPTSVPGSSASRLTLLALLILTALIVGIALAFLLAYLDDRLWTREEVLDLLHLPVYGELPPTPVPGRAARTVGKPVA